MANKKLDKNQRIQTYVAYYRVSTEKQGRSGLGLQAQKLAVLGFLQGAPIVAEFTEVESGKKNQRVQLQLAIDAAKRHQAILIIAKLDRLSRNAAFIFTLRDSGVSFQCVDMPDANTLTIGIFATLAQHERELISGRTKAGLHIKKLQGIKLGSPKNLTAQARMKGTEATRRNAAKNENSRRASALIAEWKAQGKTYAQIADRLNEFGFRTPRGCMFQGTQVMRIHQRDRSV
ncbi:recombinase family protein [Larkinella insperata]|uniref:Recombinase family protein n=1 Tax=Larkinella insperata TaxID=332158 RepID=A0ABW3QFD4_9BACT